MSIDIYGMLLFMSSKLGGSFK